MRESGVRFAEVAQEAQTPEAMVLGEFLYW